MGLKTHLYFIKLVLIMTILEDYPLYFVIHSANFHLFPLIFEIFMILIVGISVGTIIQFLRIFHRFFGINLFSIFLNSSDFHHLLYVTGLFFITSPLVYCYTKLTSQIKFFKILISKIENFINKYIYKAWFN